MTLRAAATLSASRCRTQADQSLPQYRGDLRVPPVRAEFRRSSAESPGSNKRSNPRQGEETRGAAPTLGANSAALALTNGAQSATITPMVTVSYTG